MNILEFLEKEIVDKHSLEDLIAAFEEINIFAYIRKSNEYLSLQETLVARVDVYLDET